MADRKEETKGARRVVVGKPHVHGDVDGCLNEYGLRTFLNILCALPYTN
jgi:hypothetical protein